jgi:hypothetical protein
MGVGAWLPPDPPAEVVAAARAQAEIDNQRREVLPRIAEGGFGQAVCRIVLAGMVSVGSFERRSFRLARLLADLQAHGGDAKVPAIDWTRLLRDEAKLAAVAPVEALNALGSMLPDAASREQALAVAAAVMMIEPTLDNPRSEIIELLINTLEVEPDRVMDLACRLTSPVRRPAAASAAPGGGNSRPRPPSTRAPHARRRAPAGHAWPVSLKGATDMLSEARILIFGLDSQRQRSRCASCCGVVAMSIWTSVPCPAIPARPLRWCT